MSAKSMQEINKLLGISNKREKLPGKYEERYKSEDLKWNIAEIGMWSMIPAVTGSIGSAQGLRRLKENDPLFTFIDRYFPDAPYAFEPYMQDGRYVLLPDDTSHQGIGIMASKRVPGYLEVAQFWYPSEFTSGKTAFPVDQVAVTMFIVRPDKSLADMVQKVYMEDDGLAHEKHCTFPFDMDLTVLLKGNFLDRQNESVKTIRDALKDTTPQIRRNGEGLIEFMKRVVRR